jgi:AraC-like DNA-binding protein
LFASIRAGGNPERVSGFDRKEEKAVHDLGPKRLGEFPTALGTMTRLAYERAQAARLNLEPLLKKAGLTKRQVEDVHARISAQSQISFLDLVASALQDEHLGFHIGQAAELRRRFGLLYYVAASSDTLGEALRRVVRYISMVNESASLKYLEGKDVRIVTNYVGIARHLDRHQIEGWVTLLIRLCRELTGCPVQPSLVRLIHRRRANYSEFAAFLGCDIEFGAPVDDAVFPLSIADIPVVSVDPYLHKLLTANGEEALSRRRAKGGPFRAVVENAITALLPHGNARASEIARQCGLSQRTFVRRLTAENVTFSEVLNNLRRDLATQYLKDDSLSISQIAWLLGYQEVGAFSNAFKRWTGRAPRERRFAA